MNRLGILTVGIGVALLGLSAGACEGDLGDTVPGTGGTGAGGDTTTSTEAGVGNSGATDPNDCPLCVDFESGVGTANPFDPDTNPSDGVGLNDDGAIVLDAANANIPGIIWIANTNLGTVTKVDTETFDILGRYAIGSVDPSRTSVNSAGDVFVGNRAGNTLTKVSAAGEDCPDTNGDNVITTSTGFADVYAWGQDDCVIFDVSVDDSPHIRGVAAQDVIVPDPLPDWQDHTKLEHYVWVGGTSHRTVYKYDGEDGTELIQTESPTGVYGLALDGNGQLWISGRTDGNVMGRVDTTQCVDQASCDAAVICVRDCTAGACTCDAACPTACEDAVKERIELPHTPYGITVDFKQRIWLGGNNVIQRYDPALPDATKLAVVTGVPFIHGIAADANGFVWGATSNSVIRIEGDTLATELVTVPAAKGMAIDKDGKVWAIARGAEAHVVTPGPTITDNTVTANAVTGLGNCYTYSDMTGLQLALATNTPGWYRQTEEGCAEGDTTWFLMDWDVENPPGTRVQLLARTADTEADLENATWVLMATVPPDMPKVRLDQRFDNAMVEQGRYLEWEVRLEGSVDAVNGLLSPVVNRVSVAHTQCLNGPD